MSEASPGPLQDQQLRQQSSLPRWVILGGILLLMFIIPALLFVWMRADNGLVNPNTATREELMTLPEVGPQMADRILQLRPFTDESEFAKKLPEIVPQQLEQIRARLDFDGDGQGDCCVVH